MSPLKICLLTSVWMLTQKSFPFSYCSHWRTLPLPQGADDLSDGYMIPLLPGNSLVTAPFFSGKSLPRSPYENLRWS